MRQFLLVLFLLALACTSFGQSASPIRTDQQSTNPPYAIPTPTQKQELQQKLRDVHFDFDRSDLRPEDRQLLEESANWLKANPDVYVTVAGDADERGSIVYNLYLSDERAKTTRDALVSMGVPENQIVFATGWGKLYPTCLTSDESCWSQNRRAHFEPWQAGSKVALKSSPQGSERVPSSPSTGTE
jgi:peptidoglycan-associated lipoprotein